MSAEPTPGRVHIERLRLRNYRSVRACDVPLQPGLTFLVGPNGAGKSNILDGLRLISDALTTTLGEAVSEHGGLAEIVHRGARRPARVTVEVSFDAPAASGSYHLRLEVADSAYEVAEERCEFRDADGVSHDFTVSGGTIASSDPVLPLPDPDRLYLPRAANLPVFLPVYDALSTMSFYNISPTAVRAVQRPGPDAPLARDGHNLSQALALMAELAPKRKQDVEDYLGVIVPGLVSVGPLRIGQSYETVGFRQVLSDELAVEFDASAMSDGTLRVLGVLVAAFQPGRRVRSLVGIEEPEATLHPANGAVLRDALSDAAEHRQIVVTTHSPELLDDKEVDPDSILAVEAEAGATVVGPPDHAGLSSLRDGLFTAGELLRINQLIPARPPR